MEYRGTKTRKNRTVRGGSADTDEITFRRAEPWGVDAGQYRQLHFVWENDGENGLSGNGTEGNSEDPCRNGKDQEQKGDGSHL